MPLLSYTVSTKKCGMPNIATTASLTMQIQFYQINNGTMNSIDYYGKLLKLSPN